MDFDTCSRASLSIQRGRELGHLGHRFLQVVFAGDDENICVSHKDVALSLKAHPAVAQMNAAWMVLRAFCSEFGLSPVSRTRLAIDKPDHGDDELLEILSQPRERRQQPTEVIQ